MTQNVLGAIPEVNRKSLIDPKVLDVTGIITFKPDMVKNSVI